MGHAGRGPQPAVMRFDDRAANRQSHSHLEDQEDIRRRRRAVEQEHETGSLSMLAPRRVRVQRCYLLRRVTAPAIGRPIAHHPRPPRSHCTPLPKTGKRTMSPNISPQRSSRLSFPRLSMTRRPILAPIHPGPALPSYNRQHPIGLSRPTIVLAAQPTPQPFALDRNPNLDVQALN